MKSKEHIFLKYIYMIKNGQSSFIYYTSRKNSSQPRILCIISPDRSVMSPIIPELGSCYQPSVSPDGRRIALVALTYKDIVIYDVTTGDMGNLTQTPEKIELHPVWTPCGNRIMFQDIAGLWTIKSDGTEKKFIDFSHNFSMICEPYFSPDGNGFIFCGQFYFHTRYNPFLRPLRFLVESRLDFSSWDTITRKGRVASDIYFYRDGKIFPLTAVKDAHLCKFTPDGEHISYVSRGDLWLLNLKTKNKENLTENSDFQATNHSWSPDGRHVVIQAVDGDLSNPASIVHTLVTLEIATGKYSRLTDGSTQDSYPCWAKQPERIHFLHDTGKT